MATELIAEDAAAWIKKRAPQINAVVHKRRRREAQELNRRLKNLAAEWTSMMAELRAHKKALSHCRAGLAIWIPRGSQPEQFERTVNEMRLVQQKVEELLNG